MTSKKRSQGLFLLFLLICFFIQPSLIYSQSNLDSKVEKDKLELRDQNILVPTKDGVQKATRAEFERIQELEAKPTEELIGNYIVGDYASGQILMAKGGDEIVGLASTTKLMTVYVALDAVKSGEIDLKDKVKIDHEAASLTGSTYKTKENEVYTVEQLIRAGLVVSGNDAMIALAKHIAGSQEAYIQRMDKKAKDLGLDHAHFINVHGLTDYVKDDFNKMTPKEMFILSRNLIQDYPEVLDITKTPYIKENNRGFLAYNTNPILGVVPEVDGLKTGYTNAAGKCLVATSFRPAEGKKEKTRLIGVFMNSPNSWSRYVVTKRLMEDAISRFTYERIASPKNKVGILSIEGASPQQTTVYPKEESLILLDSSKYLRPEISYDEIELPIKKGGKVGKIDYYVGDDLVYETDLVVHEEIRSPNFVFIFKDKIKEAFLNLDRIVESF